MTRNPARERREMLADIREVDRRVDGELKPATYSAMGAHSIREVLEEFTDWQSALDIAGVSDSVRIAADIRRNADEATALLSRDRYLEVGNFSMRDIRSTFSSWRDARDAAGLNSDIRKISKEELARDLNRVAEAQNKPLSVGDYEEKGMYSTGVFQLRDFSFTELREEIGLDSPDKTMPSKTVLEAWEERLMEVRGKYGFDELKSMLDETGFEYRSMYIDALKQHLQDNGFQFSVSSGGKGGKKYYIQGPESETVREYYQKYLDQVPDEKEDWFMALSGSGRQPSSIVAAIRYLTEDKSQVEIADEVGVSEITLRNAKNAMIEELDLEETLGDET